MYKNYSKRESNNNFFPRIFPRSIDRSSGNYSNLKDLILTHFHRLNICSKNTRFADPIVRVCHYLNIPLLEPSIILG